MIYLSDSECYSLLTGGADENTFARTRNMPKATPKPDGRRGPKDKPWTRLPRPTRRTGSLIGPPGSRVSDFETLTVRVPPALHARLKALAYVRQTPLWAVLATACESYVAAQDAATRAKVGRVARREHRASVAGRSSH